MSQNTEWSLQGKKPRWSNQNSCCSRLTSDLRNQHSCDTIKSLPQPTSQFFLYTMIQFCCQNSLIFLLFFLPSLPSFCPFFFPPFFPPSSLFSVLICAVVAVLTATLRQKEIKPATLMGKLYSVQFHVPTILSFTIRNAWGLSVSLSGVACACNPSIWEAEVGEL